MGTVASALGDVLTTTFIIVIVAIFILLEGSALPDKIRQVDGLSFETWARLRQIVAHVRRYMFLKTVMSLLTGALVALWLFAVGVEFPIVFEGPPGLVNGGFLAVFFDLVVQHHNCDVGVAGKTTSLTVRYRRPTPLLTELAFEVERAVADGRITSGARLPAGGEVLCEAEVRAVAGNLAALPQVPPRREGA